MRERSDSKIRNGIRQAFVVEWERATDNYGTRLFVAKRSSAVSCKLICSDAYHRPITD
ncbi:hypothetical protein [Prevotella histicola]|uniref:hypothetical protein n=1 Tax=Prevotella histicola TaxID=470565 RepID=UPI00288A0661|nr:hypothetical protein [Prevotella histicola]